MFFFDSGNRKKKLLVNKSNIKIRRGANGQNLQQTATEKAIEQADFEPQIPVLPKYCNPNQPKTTSPETNPAAASPTAKFLTDLPQTK